MCYDVSALLRKLEKLGKRQGGLSADKDILNGPSQLSAFSNARIPVLTPDSPNNLQLISWGFVPAFAKTAKDAQLWLRRSYNCRADTLLEKMTHHQHSMFKPLVNHPVVIIIQGFYEWHTTAAGQKIPYYVQMKDDEAFAVAGMAATWHDLAEPERLRSGVTLCTTSANGLLAKVHNKPTNSPDFRMPAILLPDEIDTWLNTNVAALERLALVRCYPAEEMMATSVVNYKLKVNQALDKHQPIEAHHYNIPEVATVLDGEDFMVAN